MLQCPGDELIQPIEWSIGDQHHQFWIWRRVVQKVESGNTIGVSRYDIATSSAHRFSEPTVTTGRFPDPAWWN
jgi:hypothetical protein